MSRTARAISLSVITGLLTLILAMAAFATAEGEEAPAEEEPAQTTVVTTDIEPAVEVTVPPEDAGTADWTYRYLVPTGIALAVLVILATSGQYFTNVVRKRYRIVEE